ncbi:E3 ubiquitin-protein ligase, partial [Smittium mucronatum]
MRRGSDTNIVPLSTQESKKNKNRMTQEELDSYNIVPFSLDMIKDKHFLQNTTDVGDNVELPLPNIASNATNEQQNIATSESKPADDFDCLICFEPVQTGDKIREIPCEHVFHQKCLDTWLTTRSGFCPTCRYNLHTRKSLEEQNVGDVSATTISDSIVSLVQSSNSHGF